MPKGDPPPTRKAKSQGSDGIGRGRLRRTAPLVGLSARTAGEAVVVGLRGKLTGTDTTEFHIRTANRYAELLGHSKGALMKAGQMLSFVSAAPAVPPQFQLIYQTALARLRNDALPMAPELARSVLEQELGQPAERLFSQFDWEPLGAASIGQVHQARLYDGRDVAVKIQYPGVADAIDADLKNTELLATFLSLIFGFSPRKVSFDIRGAAQEIGERIVEELDYRLEAANQREFAEIYREHPFMHVPAVIDDLSCERVLTQELASGRSWEQALDADQKLRDMWGEAIHRFTYGSYHYYGLFNADPHPGNYLFHDDGSVSFLDFGCVKRLDNHQVNALNVILRECLRGDVQRTWQMAIENGFYEPSGSLTPAEVYAHWRAPLEVYWGEQPFTITPEYVSKLIELRYSPSGPSANAFRHVITPPTYTIMSRIDVGVMSLLAELRATNQWRTIGDEYFENAEPVTEMGKADRAHREERQGALERA